MSTRTKLLQIFDGKPGQIVSGEILARRLGVSRTAVWKQIQSLKIAGLPIDGTGRQGYRLQAPFDSSLARFHPPAGIVPHYFLNAASTQTLAKAGAASGLPEGHLWIAETQTKGRGRLDRRWESAYGGLWFSLLLRPNFPASRVPPLTLLAGLCLNRTVREMSGQDSKLKWPNDIIIASPQPSRFKKLAGILTEMSGQLDRTEWVVIGVGLNVNNAVSSALASQAVSLYQLTEKTGARADYLKVFLRNFQSVYSRYQKDGFGPFRSEYWSAYFAPDKPVQLKSASGMIRGVARGVDASGAIMIESRRKIRSISEGEIVK